MKLKLLSLVLLLAIMHGCREDEPIPTDAESQAMLLAGKKGASKTWKLVGGTAQEEDELPQSFVFQDCLLDNTFIFRNNSIQSYDNNEGASKCNSSDPEIIENGNWAFTANGKIVIVVANEINIFSQSIFGRLSLPGNIVNFTETELKIRYDFPTRSLNFTFISVN